MAFLCVSEHFESIETLFATLLKGEKLCVKGKKYAETDCDSSDSDLVSTKFLISFLKSTEPGASKRKVIIKILSTFGNCRKKLLYIQKFSIKNLFQEILFKNNFETVSVQRVRS